MSILAVRFSIADLLQRTTDDEKRAQASARLFFYTRCESGTMGFLDCEARVGTFQGSVDHGLHIFEAARINVNSRVQVATPKEAKRKT